MTRDAFARFERRKAVWGSAGRVVLVVAAMAVASCGDQVRNGQSSSYLIVAALQGASGASPTQFAGTVSSDVITVVQKVPTVFADPGTVTLGLALKDAGTGSALNTPTPNNFVTVDRYHVEYKRSDGRNAQGVDVPFAFDGAFTGTISNTQGTTFGFTLVRIQAKEEAPLKTLASGSGAQVISTIAVVTFYGHDQTGREVTVSGNIEVNFANWGDPDAGS